VPAVAIGIIAIGLSWLQLFSIQYFPCNWTSALSRITEESWP
jgi:hypothetical protein